jgi:arginine repressor
MKVSQLLHVMDKDDEIVIDDYDAPIVKMRLYKGKVKGIKRDDQINKMHVASICADDDTILVLATEQTKWKLEKQ